MQLTRSMQIWVASIIFGILMAVVVGGTTRLTHSGLSIVEWNVVMGALPPTSEHDWQSEFVKYQTSPQYQLVNKGMKLSDFKFIYFWEWLHRNVGRSLGLLLLIPLVYFWSRKKLDAHLTKLFLIGLALGALQGVVGWIMVKSGLVKEPRVEPLRLALHLAMAMAAYAYFIWLFIGFSSPQDWVIRNGQATSNFKLATRVGLILVFLQLMFGAVVAGLKAGLMYNSFPLMNGVWIPEGLFALSPAVANLWENHLTAQFFHRILAWVLFAYALCQFWVGQKSAWKKQAWISLALILGQFALGIYTLLNYVPLHGGVLHQLLGVITFGWFFYLDVSIWKSANPKTIPGKGFLTSAT